MTVVYIERAQVFGICSLLCSCFKKNYYGLWKLHVGVRECVCVCVCMLCDGMLVPVVRLYWWRHLLLSSTSFRCRMLYGRRSGPVPSAVMPLGSSRRAVVARSLQKLRLPAWELRWIWSSGRRRIYSYFWLWFCPLLLSWQIWTVSIKKKSVSRHLCWLMFLWPFAVTVHSVGG